MKNKGEKYMRNYKLKENEVVRYQSSVTLQTEKGEIPAEIILTNLNFIFVTEKKFLWFKPKTRKKAFAKELVKIDKDTPAIKQTGTSVKMCFTKEDRVITFAEKKEAWKFIINAWELVTGKNIFERSLDKVKQALDLIDETMDWNIADFVKDALAIGSSIQDTIKKLFPKKK